MINIYDKVKIIYDEKQKVFGVMDTSTSVWNTIGTSKDLDTVIQIKKAYCDGYYDGYHAKEKELKTEEQSNEM